MKLDGFDILEQLGHGGMATVYRARQISLDREVAIKVFAPRFEPTPEDREQFQNEARVAARLKHPGLVQVYDAVFSGEMYCFVMELIRGYTVAQWGVRKGKLDEKTILDIADCVADALDYAWKQHHVIHCDIKPDNLMVDEDGTVKILDLGLAKTAQAIKQQALDDQVYGTPQYISPEQAIGQTDLDCRTDIYGLGASLYQLATGQTLFPGSDDAAAMEMQVRAKAPNPRTLNPELSIGFCALVEKMLAKDRDRRQKDWFEVRRDIEAARLGIPLPSGNPQPGASTVEPGPAPAYTKDTLHLHASVHAPAKLGAPDPAMAGAAPTKRRVRRTVRTTRPPISPGAATTISAASPPSRPRSKSHGPLLIALAAACVLLVSVILANGARQRKTAEEAARALAQARRAVAELPADPADFADYDRAAELFRAAAKYPVNLDAANAALADLTRRKFDIEQTRRKRAIDDLLASAEALAASGSIDLAVSRLLDYAGPGKEESEARRKAAADAIVERHRRQEEEARRRAEAEEEARQAAAAREAVERQRSAAEGQILDMLESSGIGAARDLANQKAATDPGLFESGSRCAWLLDFLRDAADTQAAFDRAFRSDAIVTVEMRNGSTLSGRILRSLKEDELRFAVRMNGVDMEQSVRMQDLAPREILKRIGNADTPGARFVRVRAFVKYDLPRPSPLFLDEQCRDFPPRIRTLALTPAR